jgi:hypothetical protein
VSSGAPATPGPERPSSVGGPSGPRLTVVVPTTHRTAEVQELIRTVRQSSPVRTGFVVVDNGPAASERGWALAGDCRLVVRQEYLGSEGGFVIGANMAAEERPDYVLLLDHDACLRPDTLGALLAHASDSTACCCRFDPPWGWGLDSRVGARHLDPQTGQFTELGFAQWSGMLLPPLAYTLLSQAEYGYFFGYDDFRFCHDLLLHGFDVRGVWGAVLGNARRPADTGSPWRLYYAARNRLLLARDTHGVLSLAMLRATVVESREIARGPGRMDRARGLLDGLLDRRGRRVLPKAVVAVADGARAFGAERTGSTSRSGRHPRVLHARSRWSRHRGGGARCG